MGWFFEKLALGAVIIFILLTIMWGIIGWILLIDTNPFENNLTTFQSVLWWFGLVYEVATVCFFFGLFIDENT